MSAEQGRLPADPACPAQQQLLAAQHRHETAARLKAMVPAVAQESVDRMAAASEWRLGDRPLASHRHAEGKEHDHDQRDQVFG
jgi:hypothetical protein